ncbi:MAG: hypothetical protein LBC62_01350 [Treponema sp.]|jgi:hypothetical protein|nr:hypothetical protein [Treponema sp.]
MDMLRRIPIAGLLVLVLFVLISGGEFFRHIRQLENAPEGDLLLTISESCILLNQVPVQQKTQNSKLWRQFISILIAALFLQSLFRLVIQKYACCIHDKISFFHTLITSLFLGGRAPPVL